MYVIAIVDDSIMPSDFVRLWEHGWKGLLLLVQCHILIL